MRELEGEVVACGEARAGARQADPRRRVTAQLRPWIDRGHRLSLAPGAARTAPAKRRDEPVLSPSTTPWPRATPRIPVPDGGQGSHAPPARHERTCSDS